MMVSEDQDEIFLSVFFTAVEELSRFAFEYLSGCYDFFRVIFSAEQSRD